MITITINGKDYLVNSPYVGRFAIDGNMDDIQVRVSYGYWSTRDGKRFGAYRSTIGGGKPASVGAQLFAAAREAYGADHDQLIADYQARNPR